MMEIQGPRANIGVRKFSRWLTFPPVLVEAGDYEPGIELTANLVCECMPELHGLTGPNIGISLRPGNAR